MPRLGTWFRRNDPLLGPHIESVRGPREQVSSSPMCFQFMLRLRSLERIESYLNIEQEPKPTPAGIPPAYWPASGNLSVDNLSAKYSQDGPTVLHDISFTIKSGERVGVVGRTGSGKSSLTLSLLRCILTDGTVYYDGLPTHSINLDALRSNITIIPQVVSRFALLAAG